MKNNEQLINNVVGQLEGIKKMLDDDRDCLKILTQLKAAKQALAALTAKILAENLIACSAVAKRGRQAGRVRELINELTKN